MVENQDANNTNNENQGAPEGVPTIKDKQDDILVEDVEEDEDTDDEEEPVGRRAEKERRASHFLTHEGDKYGRGKREKTKSSFSFLQTKFKDLTVDDKNDCFFHEAWDEYRTTGKTSMVERYSTGFIFHKCLRRKELENTAGKLNLKC